MLKSVNPTQTKAWEKLTKHYEATSSTQMKDLFGQDERRFEKFSTQFNTILVDYSKNRITEETLSLLVELAEECDLKNGIKAMFDGDPINATEGRAVLHTALRNQSSTSVKVDGVDIMPDVRAALAKMKVFANKVTSGQWLGYTNKPIKYIVNIGIGGSDLGPVMVTEALKS